MPTCKDVARIAGVSTATVTRAFRDNVSIRPETRKKILDAANSIQYTPNLEARSLKQKRSKTIGVIIPNIENQFYISVIKLIEVELRRKGYRLIIAFNDGTKNCEEDAIKLMQSSRVESIIFSPHDLQSKKMINQTVRQNIYVLQLYTKKYDDLDALMIDDINGSMIGTNYLIERGHRKILFFGDKYRTKGYIDAYIKNGLDYSSEWILDYPDINAIVEAIKRYNPTAIFAVTSKFGQNAYMAIRKSDKSIPKDISLVIYDDADWLKMLDIHAIGQPIENIAKFVVDIVIRQQTDQNRTKLCSYVNSFLIERDSVKDISK